MKSLIKKFLYLLLYICLYTTNIEASIVGATKGNADVAQGNLNYSIKIITPKGVAGIKPSLGISYNSSNDTSSLLGTGFSLDGLSTISKCYEDQREYYCLDGQKLLLLDESLTYGALNSEYRLEINNQSKIIKQEEGFTVYTKDGLISSYGNSPDSKDSDNLYRINQIKDRFDNKIVFNYSNLTNEKQITQISYSNNQIDFIYEERDDKEVIYLEGSRIDLNKRLESISVKTAGEEVSSYKFTYDYIKGKSRITTVKECSNGECLEPLKFNWTTNQENTILKDANLAYKDTNSSLKDWEIYTYDMNNDSFPDLIQSYKGSSGHKLKVSLRDGNDFQSAKRWFSDTNSALKDWEIYLRDINADGLPDLVQSYKGTAGHRLKVSLNTGTSFENTKLWFSSTSSALKDWDIYLQDINTDGLPDLVQSYKGTAGHKLKVSLSTGESFKNTKLLLNDTNSALKDWNIYLMDMNSDTLLDIVQSYKGDLGHRLKVSLNKGNNTFSSPKIWFSDTNSSLKDWDIYLQDINADSLPDLVQSYKGTAGHRLKASLNTGTGFDVSKLLFNNTSSALKDWGLYLQDINNDSYPDLIQFYKGVNGHKFKVSQSNNGLSFKEPVLWLNETNSALKDWEIYLSDTSGDMYHDLIQSYKGDLGHRFKIRVNNDHFTKVQNITNNKDENIDITYSSLQDNTLYHSDTTSTYPKADIKSSSMTVVKSLKTDNGVGGQNETLFEYKDFKVDVKKGSLGFARVTTLTPVLNAKTVVNFMQDYPLSGVKSTSQNYVNDILISDENIEIAANKYFSNQNILNLETKKTEQNKYDINGDYLATSETINSNFDKYGNIGQIQTITKNDDSVYEKISTNIYTNDETKWILSRLTDAKVKHIHSDGSSITKNSAFEYDLLTGILTKEVIEPNHEKTVSKIYKYDHCGNKISQTVKASGETDRITTFEYDEEYKNIIKSVNPLGFIEQNIYDINNQAVQHTDINGLVTTFEYDPMGKKVKESRPDGTVTTWEHSWDASIPDSLYKVTQTSTGVPPLTVYYNKFNKPLRRLKTAFDGLKIYEDTFYDEKGNVIKSTMPYYSGDPVSYIYNSYDELNRQVQLKRYDKQGNEIVTSFEYNGLNLITTNPKGYKKTVINNITGKKVKVTEGQSTVTYKYDAAGNLIETVDSKDNTISLKYDIFGNKIYQNDPDMGIWHYEYNALGQLVRQTDAKGQVSTITYDLLGRVIKKDENGDISTFVYDISPKGKGKIFSSSQNGYKKEYYYDDLSRVDRVLEFIDSKQFATKYIYNSEGKLHRTVHPNGFILENQYNTQGYLSALRSPIEQESDISLLDLKENIKENLDKKINLFNLIVELNTQIELYRTKALQILNLAKKYKNVDDAVYKQLNKTAAYLIDTSLNLRERAKKYQEEYERYKKQLEYYTVKLVNQNDENLYKWLIERYSAYSTELISKALNQLNDALNTLNTIETQELLDIYKDMIIYRIGEAKTIIFEAKKVQEQYKNYQTKYENLVENNTYLGMFENNDYKYYYKILKTDVFGRITKSFHGNGLVTNKTYDTHNGQLTHITTGYDGNNDIRDIEYSYDILDNVTKKQDHKQNIVQRYSYDNLDRVISANTVTSNTDETITYEYDLLGNMLYKSDLGNYTYNKAHQLATAGNITYTYDENGNVTEKSKAGKNTAIEYNSYNKPVLLQNDTATTRFYYNPDRSRYKKTKDDTTTYYIAKYYEEEITSSYIMQKNYIYAGKELVAVHTIQDDGNIKLPQNRYLHKDSLGSVDTITNESGIVIQRLSYNPFGKQLVQEWINDNYSNTPIVKRGYTGHEHIKEFGLIHMNGRVYDPDTARFLSADPNIQAPYDTQSYNRYSYVKNNPLKYTDPSGFFFKKLFRAVSKVWKKVKKVVIAVVAVVVAVYTGGAALAAMGYGSAASLSAAAATYSAAASAGAWGSLMAAGAASGFAAAVVSTKLNGGSWSDSLKAGVKGAVVGAISAGLSYGVAEVVNSHSVSFFNASKEGWGVATLKATLHGITRAAMAKAQGDKTSSAFWSGFVSSGFSIGNKGYGGIEARTAIMAIVGGTTSAISGGKFANGAVTGAFVHMFNDEALRWSEEDTQRHNLEVEAIQKSTPGQPHYKLGTWKCEDSFFCSVAKGAWDGYDIGNEAGDFVDAYKNQYDLIKNVGRFYGTVLGAIQGAYEYNKRQQVTNKKEEIIK